MRPCFTTWGVTTDLFPPRRQGAGLSIGFIVYSDYLCPWCFNAFVRLTEIEEEYGSKVDFDWRCYLLRPDPRAPNADGLALEKFRRYTKSWRRPAAEIDSGVFGTWGEATPPSHSVPAQVAANAAKRSGRAPFRRFQRELFAAYFSECRNISSEEVLVECWKGARLSMAEFPQLSDPKIGQSVLEEHREALECGATGVPGVRLRENPAIVVGAQPVEVYRRWIERQLARA